MRDKWHKDKNCDVVNCAFRWAIEWFLFIYITAEAHHETVSSIYGFKVNAEKDLKTTGN